MCSKKFRNFDVFELFFHYKGFKFKMHKKLLYKWIKQRIKYLNLLNFNRYKYFDLNGARLEFPFLRKSYILSNY